MAKISKEEKEVEVIETMDEMEGVELQTTFNEDTIEDLNDEGFIIENAEEVESDENENN